MSFHEDLLARAQLIWDSMLGHPFLKDTADGRIADAVFANWMQQDYLFASTAFASSRCWSQKRRLPFPSS